MTNINDYIKYHLKICSEINADSSTVTFKSAFYELTIEVKRLK